MRIGEAANYLGYSVSGVAKASREGRINFTTSTSGQRHYTKADLDAFLGHAASEPDRVEALYCRVSGSSGQETSLANQETELRASASGEVFRVYRDRASGLREHRKGLDALLDDAERGLFTVVRVTHRDRLARFGVEWIERLLAAHGVSIEVMHESADASLHDELLSDFMALVASFSGRFYRMRSRDNQRRLLAAARENIDAREDT